MRVSTVRDAHPRSVAPWHDGGMHRQWTAEVVADGAVGAGRGADLGRPDRGARVRRHPGPAGPPLPPGRRARHVALPTPLDIGSVAVRAGRRAGGGAGRRLLGDRARVGRRGAGSRPVEADLPDLRFNDGKCDPVGPLPRGLDGLRQARAAPAASTGSIRTGRSSSSSTGSRSRTGSPGRRTAGRSTTSTRRLRRIDAFDYDLATGAISNRRTAHRPSPPDEPGDLDGMTMDTDGGLWVALWNGWKVVRFAPGRRHRCRRRRARLARHERASSAARTSTTSTSRAPGPS